MEETWKQHLDRDAIEGYKAQAVQSALMGIPVTYSRHNARDGKLTPNMAKGDGFSIIWHEYSYGADYRDEVELWLTGEEEQPKRVLLTELRELVTNG